MDRYQRDGFGLWAVVERTEQCVIGQCGITLQDYRGIQVPEIGYLLRKEYWHKGYATEAARACKVYAFECLGLEKVYSIIRDTNTASQQVALRNGMQPIDCITKHYRGVDMPHIVYCITR